MSGKHETNENKKVSNNKRIKLNKLRIAFIVIGLAYLIITIRMYIAIMKTNMLPSLYVAIFTTIVAILTILLVIGLTKKHKTLKLNIFCLILILIISSGYIFANHYVDLTMNFLGKILTEVAEVEQYYVVARKDSKYEKIEDIGGKEISVFQIEEDVKQKIQSKANIEFKIEESLIQLGNSLLNNESEAIVLSASQYDIISEELEGFKENTKIIATETHKVTQESIENENSNYIIGNGIFNIYVSGMDTFGSINKVARTDANMLITVNMNTHEILLTSIPRDYYVTLHSKKAKDKLTHSGIYGITETVTSVEDLLDIDINYYVRVNFTTLIKVIDKIGGIDVESDYNFYVNTEEYKQSYSFKKGSNHLSGEAALAFSRERNSFKDGDNQRIKNQQKVIEAIINKVLNTKTILTKYSDILESLAGSFNTNIEQKDISILVQGQLEKMPSWNIKQISLKGTDASKPTYSMGSQLLYVMLPNEESIKEAKSEINKVMGK